jgi:hypothetical protein
MLTVEKTPNQIKKSQRPSRGGMAREIAKDLLRRGWVPTFIRGHIGRSSEDPLDSVADETWTAMRDILKEP